MGASFDFDTIFSAIPWGLAALFLLVVGASIGISMLYGAFKSRIRVITILACAGLAFALTLILKATGSTVYVSFQSMVESELASVSSDIAELLQSESLRNTVVGMLGALVAPLLFFMIFLILRILSWIIFIIVTAVNSQKIKDKEQTIKGRKLWAAAQGLIQGLVIFFVIMTPIYAYEQVAYQVSQMEFQQTAENSEQEPTETEQQAQALRTAIQTTDKNVFFKVHGVLLGKPVYRALTTFKVYQDGQTYQTSVEKELDVVKDLIAEASTLTGVKIADYDLAQGESVKKLAGYFEKSRLLPLLVGEVLYQATDRWLNDQQIFGMAKPAINEVIDPSFEVLLKDFRQDSKNIPQLVKDIQTIGEVFSILAEEGVFKYLGENSGASDDFIEVLLKGNTIPRVTEELKKNETLKNLNPELAKIGMRAVGSNIMNLPDNAEQIFDDYVGDVTDAINEVLSAGTREEQVQKLTDELQRAIDENGLDIEIDQAIVELYADSILDVIGDKDAVTEDDIRELFEAYTAANG